MDFNIKKEDGYTLVKVLVEKLDTNIAPSLKSELVLVAGNGEVNILLDISNCRYCDSSGLSAILVANRLTSNAKGNFVLTGLQPAVEKLITISQLDNVLKIAYNHESALKMIKESGTTIFLTTHYIEEAEFLAERVAFLDEGRIVAIDTPSAFMSRQGSWAIDKLFSDNIKSVYFKTREDAKKYIAKQRGSFSLRRVNLEDTFLALTGKKVK